ncbi:NAD(P)/FAD-dependent oxidoreductase [Inquilinus sp. OTU3971]|uniref:NAD(P)/FAD-dependent oxidoreductase n=1 Tax=Inquilinus sp. OTU3971 TaxID=3043855 RepID=UPI00313A8157
MTAPDVVIIGAGPAGCTCAIRLRQRGLRVTVLEREVFPRFAIGESLLPAAWELWERLGIRQRIEEAGYPEKRGALFRIEDTDAIEEFLIRTDEFPEYFVNPFTFHVDRAHFDQLLVEAAAEAGVEIRQGCKVEDVVFRDGYAVGVRFKEGGSDHELAARAIVDASGRRTLLAGRLGRRYANPELMKVAYYTHFEGAGRRAIEDGSVVTDIHSTEGGWIWYIPLRNDIVSVGVVLDADYVREQRAGPQILFDRAITRDDLIRPWIETARPRMPLRKIPSISYLSDNFVGDGFVMIGDAAMFIDPIFSSGVMLAMRGADYAAEALADGLERGDVSEAALKPYEERIRRPIEKMHRIIVNWYRIMKSKERQHIFRISRSAPLLREQLVILLSGGFDRADLDVILTGRP